MRLRRKLAIAAAAAAAMIATTAAAFPGVPVDRPQPLPALTAQALAARYATDSRMIAQAARAASRAGNQGLARSLDAMRGEHFIDFNPRRAGPGRRGHRQPGPGHGGWPSSCPAPTPPWPRSTPGARPRPGGAAAALAAAGPRAGPRRAPRGHRLARLRRARHAQPGRADLGRRRAGRGRAAVVRGRPRPARPSGRADLPQLRLGGVRPGRAAPAGDRHRGGRQPGHGRLLGGGAAHHGPRVGGPRHRRLDPLRAARPVPRARLRHGPDVARVRRPDLRRRQRRPQRLLPAGRHRPAQPGLHRARRPGPGDRDGRRRRGRPDDPARPMSRGPETWPRRRLPGPRPRRPDRRGHARRAATARSTRSAPWPSRASSSATGWSPRWC